MKSSGGNMGDLRKSWRIINQKERKEERVEGSIPSHQIRLDRHGSLETIHAYWLHICACEGIQILMFEIKYIAEKDKLYFARLGTNGFVEAGSTRSLYFSRWWIDVYWLVVPKTPSWRQMMQRDQKGNGKPSKIWSWSRKGWSKPRHEQTAWGSLYL